ncbi:MAG: glycoside hydrolase family 92 protein [Bacteroidales bacterium]|nr:glycoside hydrolase family 92 protein [Bacteroidales bacterium]
MSLTNLLRAASLAAVFVTATPTEAVAKLTDHVNPFLGTATLWEPEDLGYVRKQKNRTWGAEVFPGAALPNAMVQLTPVTMWHAGAGYQYEDPTILGFAHTAMGHWNLIDLPILPVSGKFSADDYASAYSHTNESARPGYYQVYLDRYGVNAELTSALRSGIHRYTFPKKAEKKLLINVAHNQNPVRDWDIKKVGPNAFAGRQGNGFFYYAVTDYPIGDIKILESKQEKGSPVAVVDFKGSKSDRPLEVRIGISTVSIENAKANLEAEVLGKTFGEVAADADSTWEALLSKVNVEGSTDRYRNLLYTTLYRAMLMPRLQSDVNGEFRDNRGNIVKDADFRYYTNPAFWDVHRNQLILLGMMQPDVALDVIKSTIDRGEKSGGYIPSYFHGDHAPTFVIGSYKRGINDFDLSRAYALSLKSATVPGRNGRRYLDEYMKNGYIADENLPDCPFWDEHKGGVTKTLEYAYDDYAVAQIAKELGDSTNYAMLMERSKNYKNVFDPSTGFFRGRIEGGAWLTPYDPGMPYYQQMYREANGWNSLFYAPHDPEGVVALYPSAEAVDAKLDSMLVEPWCGLEVANMTGFIGNYCHGNQPGHNIPYTYYFIGKQEKSQALLNQIMDRFYDMGAEKLAYGGMDDAGEMSAWFVLNALGLYTYSPADPEYIVSVPLFDKVSFKIGDKPFTIIKKGSGNKIGRITVGNETLDGYFIGHDKLAEGDTMTIYTE